MKKFFTVFVFILILIFPFSVFGSTSFTSIAAFGDSLTDNGSYTFNTNPNPADIHGIQYFTDGAVWVEKLASTLECSLSDVAYGGATTGYDNPFIQKDITGLLWQVEVAGPSMAITDDTLVTVWAGANDFFQQRDFKNAATNIGIALDTLSNYGAANILVPNLPDQGLIPRVYTDPEISAAATQWTRAFNSELYSVLQTFTKENPSVSLYFLDVYSLFSDIMLMGEETINPIYWEAFFMEDGIHPTNFGHTILAAEAYAVLQEAPMSTPIPAAAWLLGTGFIGLIGMHRRTKNHS